MRQNRWNSSRRGDAPFAIPDSPGFRDELAQYLKEKYPNPDDLVREWAPADGLPGGYSEAARLVPMQHGAGYAMDPQSSRLVRCSGKVWRDISHFRLYARFKPWRA